MIADVPVAPAVTAMILGPLAEQQLRRALAISDGDPSILLSGPINIVLWSIVALALLLPPTLAVLRRRRHATPAAAERG